MSMKIKDLFDYKYGVNLELINCQETIKEDKESVNFVARTGMNNGVVSRVKIIEGLTPQKAGTLSLAVSGSVLSCFVQTEDYYSGRDLYVLTPKINLSLEQKLFYAMCINQNSYRYSYGRAANKTFPDIEIPELSTSNNIISNYEIKKITSNNKQLNKVLDTNKWKEFRVEDIFITKKIRGACPPFSSLEKGNVDVVSTTELNNGVIGKYNVEQAYKHKITVSFNGACGYFSFHEKFFNANGDVGILQEKFKLNKYNAIFLCTILNKLSYKYQYGRKLNGNRLKDEIILLPTKDNNQPDWEYMENYIKSLPYGDRI